MVNRLASEMRAREEEQNPRAVIGDNNPPRPHELLRETILETYAKELERVEPIAEKANSSPGRITTDEELKVWTGVYIEADQLYKSLNVARLNEKRPLEDMLKAIFGPTLERLERITQHARKLADDYNREKVRRQRAEQEAEQARLRAEAEEKRKAAEIAAEFGDVDGVMEHAKGASSAEAQLADVTTSAPTVADVARVRSEEGGLSTAKAEWKFRVTDYGKVDLNALRQFIPPKDIEKAIGKLVKIQQGNTRLDGVEVYQDIATQFRR